MSTLYQQIQSNQRRSLAIIIVFIGFIVGLGYLFGVALNYGYSLFVFATVFAGGSALFSYYFSDKIALTFSRAREIQRQDQARLFRTVENLSIGAGITPMPRVYLMEEPGINAFAAGRDPRHATVAITRGALEQLDDLELEGVIAHEISHIKNYDIRTMTIAVVLVGVIALASEWLIRAQWWGGDRNRESRGLVVLFAILGAILAPLIAQLLKMALSREREFLADASAALLTRYPEGLARALEKIKLQNQPLSTANSATAHLYIANPFDAASQIADLFSTHPSIDERIRRLRLA